ncbi:MAG TPA: CAP domain-containing protein, partial [Halococcus sp.]|nr:CAP domain-containing protein [Halococcus sp.]
MLRSLSRALAWMLSVVLRVAFVLAVVVFAAGFALGGVHLPSDLTELSKAVEDVGDIGTLGGVGDGGDIDTANDSGTTSVPSSNTAALNGTHLEYLVHREVNEERREHGQSILEFDTDLRAVARYHSADMAHQNYFAHTGPNGETLTDRYRKFGYRCRVQVRTFRYATGGENILYTYYDAPVRMGNKTVHYDTPKELARGVVNGWMNSTPHRKNLLKPYWEHEAIGIYIEEVNGQTRVYATQDFC